MNNKIETIEYKGYEIETFYDDVSFSPDEWGNEEMFVVYDHRDFYVKRKGFDPADIFRHINEVKRYFYNGYYVFPLYAYIHSGVALSLGRGGYPFNCPWDTSYKGFVLVKRQKGWAWTNSKARVVAEAEVKEWNQYLSGEVYGYNSEVCSCCGFYGTEGYKDMINEAKAEIDFEIEKKKKSYFTQLKILINNRVPYDVRKNTLADLKSCLA